MSVENSPMRIENYNRVLFSLNNFMVEQSETGDYNQLVNLVVDQLDKLLRPIATTYSEYDEQNRILRIKGIKANQGVLDIFLKVSGKKLSSSVTPVNDQIYEEIKADRVKLLSTLHEATGRAIPKTVSSAVSKTIGVNCYLGLSYVVDDQVFGTTVIALREEPDQSIMELLKSYAYFTSLSLKRIFTDQALNQSEQELKTISSNIVDLVAMTDVEGKFTFLSGNHLELFGYEKEELLGKSVLEIVYAEDLEKITELFSKHISSEEDGRAEYRAVRKDGNLIWVEMVGRIIFDNGEISGALFVTRDISDRKEAEQTLLEQSNFINLVIDNIPDIVFYKDINGIYLGCNREFAKHVGREKEQIIGKTDYDIYSAEEADFFRNHDQKALEQNTPRHNEEWISYPDGRKILIDTLKTPHLGPDGKLIGILGVSRDITDRKKAEEALRNSEQELRTIADNMTDVVAMADVEGRFTYLSESSYHLNGYRPSELLGKNIFELIHEEDLSALGVIFQEGVVEGRKDARVEYRVRHKKGGYIWVETIGRLVLDDNGQPSGALFTSRDISDRKQAEQKLQFQAEILDSIGDLVTATDPDGKILYVNQAECRKFGKTRDELIGKTTEIYGEDPEYGALQKEIVEATYEKGFWRGEVVNYDKDNNPFYLDCRTWGMRDADCVVHTLIGIATDITDSKKAEEALRVSEEKYRQITENISDVVWVTDAELNTVYISRSVEKLIGESVECYMDRSLEERFPPDSLNKLLHTFQEEMRIGPLAEKNRTRNFEVQHYKADGSIIWVSMHVSAIRDEDGNITGLQGVTHDITERKKAEQEINLQKERLANIVEGANVGTWEWNVQTGETILNERWAEMLGYTLEQISPVSIETWNKFTHPGDLKKSNLELKKHFNGEIIFYNIECRMKHKDGHWVWVNDRGKVISWSEDGKPLWVFGTHIDITERKKAEEQIHYIGFHDQLTDLYNRHYFEACEEELKDIPVLSVIMTDVNGLKLINDTYGHGAGDEMLKKYADLLRESFKQSDLIFRWGGDEFIVILKNTEEAKSWELCNRLVKYCGESLVKDIPLSISVGISSKLHGGDIDEAIKEAEDMMYKNKLTESKSSKSQIMKTLQQALAEKSFETKEHIDRITAVGRQFGERLGLSLSELSRLETFIMLHDIGKINIDSHILLKETTLTDEEWEEIKKHPEVGYRITRTTEEFAYIAEDILAHHERWDGNGYPQGLEGESIPYLSRLLNLIDSYDVMSNGRPYKKKLSSEEIIAEIERCSGKQFDPDLAEEFIVGLKQGFI